MIFIIPSLLAAYVIARFVPSLPVTYLAKWFIAFVLLVIANHFLINQMLPGGLSSPEVSYTYIVCSGALFGAFILLTCLLGIRDVFLLIFWLARKFSLTHYCLLLGAKTNIALAIISFALAVVGTWRAVKIPDIKHIDITLSRLPKQFDGLTVVQLTDIHASRLFDEKWVRTVVEKSNALNPDLIVITGDLLDGNVAYRENDVAPLADLHAKKGVYVVTGNHEYYSNYTQWMDKFRTLGLHVLSNEHVTIEENGTGIVLAGTTDRVSERFNLPAPDIERALDGSDKMMPVILLEHNPKDACKNAQAGVDLQLSGHTHGGQILGIHWLNQIMNAGFVSGLYEINGMQLYVSNGTGLWNGFPIRIGVESEITEITLHSAENPQEN